MSGAAAVLDTRTAARSRKPAVLVRLSAPAMALGLLLVALGGARSNARYACAMTNRTRTTSAIPQAVRTNPLKMVLRIEL